MAHPNDERRDVDAERVDLGSSADRLVGAIVGGSYRLTRRIGSGSSSHVFEVEHLRLGKSLGLRSRLSLDECVRALEGKLSR